MRTELTHVLACALALCSTVGAAAPAMLSAQDWRLDELLAAVSPRIAYSDATLRAWNQLSNPFKRAELAPVAHGAESDALLDVALIQSYIQEASKLAARSIAERNAMQRVYANARGC